MNKKFIPVALVAVLVLAGLALWLGLRGGLGGGKGAADITVYAPAGTEVIAIESSSEEDVNPSVEMFEVPASGALALTLENGEYEILVNNGDMYNPWVKKVTVTGLYSTELYPFFFPRESRVETTDNEDAIAAFATAATLPTSEVPRTNENGTAELYVSGGSSILMNWTGELEDMPEFFCPGENVEDCRLQMVHDFGVPVENVEFYGEHDELIIADLGPMIVAIEVDRRATQNIQPVYTGSAPVAFRIIDGTIYVSESGVASEVLLD